MSGLSEKLQDRAEQLFRGGLYCSEAILQTYDEFYDFRLPPQALKMATPFGAGIGAAKCTCGSITGAIMVLGVLRGRLKADEDFEEVFGLSSALHSRFVKRFKHPCCRILTKKVEWGAPEHHEYCVRFVRGAVEILQDLLDEHKLSAKSIS